MSTYGDFTRVHWGRRGKSTGRDRAGGLELFLRGDVFSTEVPYELLTLEKGNDCLKGRLGGRGIFGGIIHWYLGVYKSLYRTQQPRSTLTRDTRRLLTHIFHSATDSHGRTKP